MKNKVQLITYADRLGTGTLASMTDILRTRFDGVYEGVHILPFFTPFDGADAGFDPIDHTAVDPRLGDWDDVAELARTHGIMVDAIVNHMSWESSQFQDVLAKGEESKYFPMFLMMSTVYPDGATEEELAGIYRPRPGLPFTHYTCGGKTRLVWTTFTPQQVDIDTDSEQGWAYLMSIFDRMAASHVSYIRLDAVGYGAKEADSSCFMTPKTFELIGRLREEGAKRGLEILIEVHSYYRKQIEIASKVDRVYDFALPPLLLHSLFTGHVEPVAHWTAVRPNNAVTVLDTHDGIGVIDIGSDQLDRSLKGLIPDEDVDALVNTIHANTHGESAAAPAPPPRTWTCTRSTARITPRSAATTSTIWQPAPCSSSCRACLRSTTSARWPAATTWICSTAPTSAATSTATTTRSPRSTRTSNVRWSRP